MRNLKKILALVLALVMSLSLMATASAAETTVAANDYTIASTVLQGLGVVRGDDGGIRESDPITRAEVATLAYRIHTADVKDEKANLYHDLSTVAFKDLAPVSAWALGYIGYAHNAQIVKGNGDGTFNPNGNITGYEVLAMALRAIGYGKNGEFEGAEWQINTAAWGRREGLLDGVSAADQTRLDLPASRGMVFQILLNAIQHEDMGKSYTTTDLYAGLGDSMAKRLHLEVETGVVIANQWAALDAASPLGEGKVKVEVTDGTTRILNWSADTKETGGEYAEGLKDIGKSRTIYMQDSKVLYLADTGKNVVKDNEGKKTTVNTLKDGLTVNDSTQHFANFADIDKITADMRIEVRLSIAPSAIGDGVLQFNVAEKVIADALDASKTAASTGRLTYEKVIPAGTVLTANQITVIKEIFRVADDVNNSLYIKGEVFVGTKSNSDSDDVSNGISYAKFDETYLNHEKGTISDVGNGNWLQVVDNDADGVAEYVLRVNYDLDTIVENKSDKFYYRGLDLDNYTPVEVEGYTQTVGDVVLYAKIDGKAYVHKADTATATFKAVNYKDRTATDTEGKVWEQSDIVNNTTLPGTLTDVDELTSYNMYLDDYGFVRAYDNNVGYALLTEMYPTTDWNSAWVVNRELTAEAMLVGDTAVREYKVLNSWYVNDPNPFFTGINGGWWYPGITNIRNNIQYADRLNYLQPATHMLDVAGKEGFVFDYIGAKDAYAYSDGTSSVNNGDLQLRLKDDKTPVLENKTYTDGWNNTSTTFNKTNYNRHSWTNVAKYTQTENGLNLYTAAGTSSNVTTDYIRLNSNVTGINKNNPLFTVQDQFYDEIYTSANRHYVRAVDSTVFFLVTVNKNGTTQAIRQYTGYSNVPTLTSDNAIRSMYAVAHTNTANDVNVNDNNYWVADVIVIEMYDYTAYESISLIYSNDYKNQGDVKYVEAIDSVKGEIRIIPNNYNVWNGRFQGYGFYGLNNVVAVEGETNTYTADITHITDDATATNLGWYEDNNYNKNGIYYGQVRSLWSEDGYSNYITLDVLDHNGLVVDTRDVRVTLGAWGIKDNTTYNSAVPLLLKSTTVNNKVMKGDKVMWVETSSVGEAKTAGFLVDLTDTYADEWTVGTSKRSYNPTPDFLWAEAKLMGYSQYTGKTIETPWNYEEVIGKRNDQHVPAVKSAAWRPQDGFVVDTYELEVYDAATKTYKSLEPSYSDENNADGLWHLHYSITPGSIVRVRVVRNDLMQKDLVLNSAKNPVTSTKWNANGTLKAAGTGIDVWGYSTWTFVMPNPGTGKTVLGTIFEDSTSIPTIVTDADVSVNEVTVVYGSPEIYVAYIEAQKTLTNTAIAAEKTVEGLTLTTAQKAERIEAIKAELAKALAKLDAVVEYYNDNVSDVDTVVDNGVKAINAAIVGTDRTDADAQKAVAAKKADVQAKLNAATWMDAAEKAELQDKLDAIKADKATLATEAGLLADLAAIEAKIPARPENLVAVTLSYELLGEVLNKDRPHVFSYERQLDGTVIVLKGDVESYEYVQYADSYTLEGAKKNDDGNWVVNPEGASAITITVTLKVGGTELSASQGTGRILSARALSGATTPIKTTFLMDDGQKPSSDIRFIPGDKKLDENVIYDWTTLVKNVTFPNGKVKWTVSGTIPTAFRDELVNTLKVTEFVALPKPVEDKVTVALTADSDPEGVSWTVDKTTGSPATAKTNDVVKVTAPAGATVEINGEKVTEYTVKASDTKVEIKVTVEELPQNGLLTYRAAKTGSTNTTYEFYGYKDKVVLTEDEAKTALAVALSTDKLTLTKNDINIATNGLTAWYTDANGATQTVALEPKGADGTYGHWTATKELFAIHYGDEIVYYAYKDEVIGEFAVADTVDGYVMWEPDGVFVDAAFEVDEGTVKMHSFNYDEDKTLVDVIKVGVNNGRWQYKEDGAWSADNSSGYVIPGTEISFWIGQTNVDTTIATMGQYRVAVNKNTFKTMTGTEVNAAISGGNVVVELGALTADMADNGVADLTIKRVYNVNLDGNPVDGAYAEGEPISVGDLEVGTLVVAPVDGGLIYTGGASSTGYPSDTVNAADSTCDTKYVALDAYMAATVAADGKTVELYSAVQVTWPSTQTPIVISYGEEEFSGTVNEGMAWNKHYLRTGSTLEITSSDFNKMFFVSVGSGDAEFRGAPSADEKTVITIEIGSQPIVINEVDAPRPLYIQLLSGSPSPSKITTKSTIEGSVLAFSADNAGNTAVTKDGNYTVTVEKIGETESVRPGVPVTTYEANKTYKVTATGIATKGNYTFAGLSGADIQVMTGTMAGWTLETAEVTMKADGTIDVEFVLFSGALS